ncbi:hypothetical protein RF11_07611 [Thelohanellus kitauei]|uniref:Tc1-like transposase DDE domain-containing protein n=1 Tax=Thelohanellus kitauei TaxID=669202 RepID=A0A0C2JE58_THEKT|nr:hypothetical protein RF11_07611 [Thelohanellus kitauei]
MNQQNDEEKTLWLLRKPLKGLLNVYSLGIDATRAHDWENEDQYHLGNEKWFFAFEGMLIRSVSDLGDADRLTLFKARDHPFNEEHFCGHFTEVFELFLSDGKQECVSIMDNMRFHSTNNFQTTVQENGRSVIYL